MRVKIDYLLSNQFAHPKVAHCEVDNQQFWVSGETWEDAKQKIIEKVSEYLEEKNATIPQPEEVEI